MSRIEKKYEPSTYENTNCEKGKIQVQQPECKTSIVDLVSRIEKLSDQCSNISECIKGTVYGSEPKSSGKLAAVGDTTITGRLEEITSILRNAVNVCEYVEKHL